MKVIYSEKHRLHAPPCQFAGGGMVPYPEVPERAEAILRTLRAQGMEEVVAPGRFPMDAIRAVHDAGYLHYLEHVHASWTEAGRAQENGLIPDTFAMRTLPGRPEALFRRAGYYCFETQTPILAHTWEVALEAAFCALTGAEALLSGARAAYALCRPPGHHAAGDVYGGYCYLNHAAIAASCLNGAGRVAVLDVDYHHGNGTQAIFYGEDAVLFVSLHADPNRKYPYFSGYTDEVGDGAGRGFNLNLPLEAGVGERGYLAALDRGLAAVGAFGPAFLVVSLGVDIYRGDPLGDFDLGLEAFSKVGRRIGEMGLPTLFVQEGGYDLETVGACVWNTLEGFENSA